jgi:hypothetical protein
MNPLSPAGDVIGAPVGVVARELDVPRQTLTSAIRGGKLNTVPSRVGDTRVYISLDHTFVQWLVEYRMRKADGEISEQLKERLNTINKLTQQ